MNKEQKDKFIELLVKYLEKDISKGRICDHKGNEINAMFDFIDKLDNWISVEDELPEENGYYLCFAPNDDDIEAIIVLEFNDNKCWWDYDNLLTEYITHWQSLPKPPKEEK